MQRGRTGCWGAVRRGVAFIIGIIFFMSGVYKLLDPVGSGMVVEEYYRFMHLGFLSFSAKAVAVILAFLETVVGCALMTGVWRKPVAVISSAMILFFTLLSAILLIFNPQMDCGCFGQAVHLTHKETFFKNLALCAAAAIAFLPFMRLGVPKARKYVSFVVVSSSVAVFSVYSLLYIPMKDYTDFKVGTVLASASEQVTEDFESVFIYSKDGQTAEFTLDNLPDSTWTFVDTRINRISTVSTTSNPVFSIKDAVGNYHDSILDFGKSFVIVIHDPSSMSRRMLRAAAAFSHRVEAEGIRFMAVSANTRPEDLEKVKMKEPEAFAVIESNLYFSDFKTLVSLNRSNGGAVFFEDGVLVRKWSWRSLPDEEDVRMFAEDELTDLLLASSSRGRLLFQGFLLYVFAVLLLL
ncbi:MAG: MauE/DoxX family redox-associated membrane protein [Candidatus Cryptobacteroides sp.]